MGTILRAKETPLHVRMSTIRKTKGALLEVPWGAPFEGLKGCTRRGTTKGQMGAIGGAESERGTKPGLAKGISWPQPGSAASE